MCESHGGTYKGNKVLEIDGKPRNIDPCIYPLVKALNDGGLKTIASCCGHGKVLGSVILSDFQELVIAPNWQMARDIQKQFLP